MTVEPRVLKFNDCAQTQPQPISPNGPDSLDTYRMGHHSVVDYENLVHFQASEEHKSVSTQHEIAADEHRLADGKRERMVRSQTGGTGDPAAGTPEVIPIPNIAAESGSRARQARRRSEKRIVSSGHVIVSDHDAVDLENTATADARGWSRVCTWQGDVTACDWAEVTAGGGARVTTASHWARLTLRQNARGFLTDWAHADASDHAIVTATDWATVHATGQSRITASGDSRVIASGYAYVEADGHSQIIASGNATVVVHSPKARVTASGSVTIISNFRQHITIVSPADHVRIEPQIP
jgi:hypothetical protein